MKRLIYITIFFIGSIAHSFALIKVDITRGNLDPLPIAVSPLHVDDKSQKLEDMKVNDLGLKISKIIDELKDLKNE